MAKCSKCDYPYATSKSCPNCGSKNPTGSTWSWLLVLIVLFIAAKTCGK